MFNNHFRNKNILLIATEWALYIIVALAVIFIASVFI